MVQLVNDRFKACHHTKTKTWLRQHYRTSKKRYRCIVDQAKRIGNATKIDRAHNPYQAAWKIINSSHKNNSVLISKASPDVFDNFFVNSVAEIVDGFGGSAKDPLLVAVQKVSDGSLNSWMMGHDDVLKIVMKFSNSRSPHFYGMSVYLLL